MDSTPSTSSARKTATTHPASHHIHRATCPRIAVLSSPDVSEVLQPNAFSDFAQCLQPFEDSVQGVTVRTSQLESKQCPTFPVRFDTLDAFRRQPRPSIDDDRQAGPSSSSSRNCRPEEVLDIINAKVSTGSRSVEYPVSSLQDATTAEGIQQLINRDVQDNTPWFADARDAILQTRTVSRHETFGHPVAVLLAVSTRSPDPLNAFSSLFSATQPQNCDVFQHSPFIDPNILRYYVLLHDESQGTDIQESKAILESVKKIYGLNCCILPINSNTQNESVPDLAQLWHQTAISIDSRPPTARLLNDEDVKRLKGFIRELVAQGLVPWMERCVSQWNESIAASRKGLTGRLFGAGKKFFGSSASSARSGTGTASDRPTWNPQASFYPHAALEAQTRRLADFAFMTHDYKLAAATYDIGRKDYGNDKAFQYAAGATEMFGISHLMMMMGTASPPIDVDSYLSSACTMYRMSSPTSGGSSGALLRPVKATLLYYEAYRALDFYRPAPAGLLRAAQDPEADLEVVSAMLLEQAAFADLHTRPNPSLRKWALHLTMAGHKYRQCGAKQLSLRCFHGAKAAYDRSQTSVKQFFDEDEDTAKEDDSESITPVPSSADGWTLIQDQVELELGRQAFNDGDCEQAVDHFLTLIHPQSTGATAPADQQQDAQLQQPLHEMYLKELLAAFNSLPESSARRQTSFSPAWPFFRSDQSRVSTNTSTADTSSEVDPQSDGPEWRRLEEAIATGKRGDNQTNAAAINEPFSVQLHVQNPLASEVALSSISVKIVNDATGEVASDAEVEVSPIEDITLDPLEGSTLSVRVSIAQAGTYRVSRVSYTLSGAILFNQDLMKQGKRLNVTRQQRVSKVPIYAPDETLAVVVGEPRPALSVKINGVPEHLGLGEEVEADMMVENVGKASLRGLRFVLDHPESVQLLVRTREEPSGEAISLSNHVSFPGPVKISTSEDGDDGVLQAGQIHSCKLLIRGSALGLQTTRLVFGFNDDCGAAVASHRATLGFEVFPVVDIGVDISPAAKGFAYDLALSAVNLIPSGETVAVKRAVFVSPRWRAIHEEGPSSLQTAFSALPPMQACRAVIGVQEAAESEQDPATILSHTSEQLRTLLIGRDIDRSARPGDVRLQVSSDAGETTPTSSRFLSASRSQWRRTQLQEQFQAISQADRERVFTLYQPEDLDVLVSWETSNGQRRGQVFIFGLSLGPACNRLDAVLKGSAGGGRSLYEETAKQKAAVLSNLTQSQLATEEDPLVVDFDTGDVGDNTLPVTFRVRNMSTTRHARCVIDLDSSVESEVDLSAGPRKASWLGRLTLRSGIIAPRSGVELTAVAGRPPAQGETELGDWSIKTEVLDGNVDPRVLQNFASGRLRSGKVVSFHSPA